MPKLRNAGTDVEMFVQWLGRKCRNHNPLSELGIKGRAHLGDRYHAKQPGNLFVKGEDTSTLVYMANDRAFEITVKEVPVVNVEAIDKKQRVAVGS